MVPASSKVPIIPVPITPHNPSFVQSPHYTLAITPHGPSFVPTIPVPITPHDPSFVQSAADVKAIREVLGLRGRSVKIISKIENEEGLKNFDEILEVRN